MVPASRATSALTHGTLLSRSARPLRFVGTGGCAAIVQLCLLTLLSRVGWQALPANAVAFFIAAQVNFALSTTFTWRDRAGTGRLPGCWLLFHAAIGLMAVVNMAVFAVGREFLPLEVASLSGIAAGSVGNYILGDRFVFRDALDSHPSWRAA